MATLTTKSSGCEPRGLFRSAIGRGRVGRHLGRSSSVTNCGSLNVNECHAPKSNDCGLSEGRRDWPKLDQRETAPRKLKSCRQSTRGWIRHKHTGPQGASAPRQKRRTERDGGAQKRQHVLVHLQVNMYHTQGVSLHVTRQGHPGEL